MRTNIEIDRKAVSIATKRETVEEALRLLARLKSREAIRCYRGKLAWEGDLEAMRADRDPRR
jgi:hypothetical protein